MKNNKGFTLIELLAVILILGIIALIAIPTVSSVVEQSRRGAEESTGTEMVKAAEQYLMKVELNDKKDGDLTLSQLQADLMTGLTGTEAQKAAALAKRIDVKGDIPTKIIYFAQNSNGDVLLRFESTKISGETCSNYKVSGDNKILNDKGNVKCTTTADIDN